MEINIDCLREVLQYCVDNIDYQESNDDDWEAKHVNLIMLYDSDLKYRYTKKEIMYSVVKLEECHFIKVFQKFPPDRPYLERCTIEDVTFRGHQFLDSIKDPTIWEKTKSVAKTVGNHTLSFLEGTAHDIAVESAKIAVSAMIKNREG